MGMIILILLIIGITFSIGAISAAPWVPMRAADVARVVKILEARNFGNKNFVELGSGDGRLLAAMAKTGAQAVGYEISMLPLILSWVRWLLAKKKFTVKTKNFWAADLQNIDAVFVFLMPRVLGRFREKMEAELKPGALVINYVWPIPGWEPLLVDAPPGHNKIYVYERP